MTAAPVLVTGASGLAGSNACRTLVAAGRPVRALVRDDTSAAVLADLGCAVVRGDLLDADVVARCVAGVSGVIHCAAVLGGTWSTATPEEFDAVNYGAVVTLLDAAARAGGPRCVLLSSAIVLDMRHTLTEVSPLVAPQAGERSYLMAKLAAYHYAMHAACRGQDVVLVLPGAIYGPGPLVERALHPTSFNAPLLAGLRGELDGYLDMSLNWAFVDEVVDVAVAALDRGKPGRRYLAFGRPADACSLPAMCNRLNELAGVAHRVREVDPAAGDFGSMNRLGALRQADPPFDSTATQRVLGTVPATREEGLRRTLAWLRDSGRVPVSALA